ncbi:oxidoreductase [Aureococcus anophagefferens]|nr:oxidoreductase [Aureococcus anophagefferens]
MVWLTQLALLPLAASALHLRASDVDRRALLRTVGGTVGGTVAAPLLHSAPALAAGAGPVYDDNAAYKYTMLALECGYRNFFASVLAGNQRGFGKAVRASGIPRSDLYVCGSVLSNRARGFDAAYAASKRGCDENLAALDVGPLDNIMLDYPGAPPACGDADSIAGQWRALEAMKKDKAVRSLSLSNFSPGQLDYVLALDGVVKPTVNQLPLGVGFKTKQNAYLLEENRKRGIVVQAWSPLRVLSPEAKKACADVGKPYGKSPQQVALSGSRQGRDRTCQTTSRPPPRTSTSTTPCRRDVAALDAVGA